ncbi:MAG: hypothetical protein PHG61_08415, partial [Candidatus Marinimicrobia bacterium]|nr:hypothetical protein [Candidatus Neomarinimicrobiota bacterium]
MKANSLTPIFLMTAALFISGCYTQFSAPIAREESYKQLAPDTTYQEEQIYENYTFDSSDLNDYRLGYHDGYWDSMNSNLWWGYNAYSPFYHSYRYHSPYLGYYDPWYYDPFYDWGFYGSFSYYGGYYPHHWYSPYYSYYGYYGDYHHRPRWYGDWYHYGAGKTYVEGRDQLKPEYIPKTTVSGSRGSSGSAD